MVSSHLSPSQRLASGIRFPSEGTSAWAATQAASRFLNNPRVGLPTLIKPLLAAAAQGVEADCDSHVLAVHDWSDLTYRRHHGKRDRLGPKGKPWKDGYHLYSCLMVGDRAGAPLAPVVLSLEAADGVHCTRSRVVRARQSNLDGLDPAMTFVEKLGFAKPVVHVIDAEADSVAHYREWSACPGRLFLVRADDRIVEWRGTEQRCSAIQQTLRNEGAFTETREVEYRGKPAWQWVADVPVRLLRPGQRNRADGSQNRVPGGPLALRLIVCETRSSEGSLLATWYLLTNVSDVSSDTMALWYYWRWRIEKFYKLLKSAGFNLEDWRQETAAAIARRLVVVGMACVVIWTLARNETAEAAESRRFLVQLSGRQMARGKEFTEPALLAGLWVLLQMQRALENYDPDTLRRMIDTILPRAGP